MKNKQLRIIMVVVFALILVITGLTTKTMLDATKQFNQDGYVLVPSRDTEVTTNVNEQYYFSAGTNYREKYGEVIQFKDTSDNEVSMSTEEFVHYNDGSMGAFTKGVVMDLAEIGDNQVTYYGVSEKTTILKQGQEYSMSYLGNGLTLNEFIWKIADDTFMLVSPEITLHLADGIEVVLEDYVQVQYVAGGIARLVHQRGTYQTVSDDAYLQTDSGFELKLTERAFYNGLEKAVSLDEMVIDSSSNLMVDENEEELKIPTFRVVNGKDGADGQDGADGSIGEDGQDGTAGDSGTSGDNGSKGQNGFDGLEGDSGEWGYDGQVGQDGKDAENSGVQDGVVGIVQESAPVVAMDPDSYQLGTNSVSMNLKVSDPNGMLTADDLECVIYKQDDMSVVHTQSFSSGGTGAAITTNMLQPGVDYVLIVTGDYTSKDHGIFSDVNLFTKLFRTDELGLRIEKVQATEDSIAVKVVKDDESLVSSYGIALYLGDDSTTNLTTFQGNTFTDSNEFIFKKDQGLNTGLEITPNTEYKIQLTNIVVYSDENKNSYSNVGADVSKVVKSLKVKPYYLEENPDGVATEVEVGNKKTVILTSSRYKTATVSLDTAIYDEHNGIIGYRYELYETATDETLITTPVQTKEVQTMESVTFNIEADKRYFARVVVLFNDNEKVVELVSTPSDIVSLTHGNYPTVQFINMEHEYDKISGYVMVEDKSAEQDMLLNHVSKDYPLILTITAQTGDKVTIPLYEGTTPPEGNADTGDMIEYYYYEADGLARDTTHTVSVSGYVNDTDLKWDQLSLTDKGKKFQYLSGYNINVGSPTPITVHMKSVPNVGDDLFTIALAFTDENGEDASYEVSNMEKISFRLVNASGVTIGTTANLMDHDETNHSSDYSDFYASHITTPDAENLPYSAVENQTYSQYVLTDESFGAKGDLRIANGGNFTIYVESAYDYTQDDTEYPNVTNELDISGTYGFEVKKSHTRVADPNNAVSVIQIQNKDAKNPVSGLEDNTVVGLTVDTGYSLSDAYQVIYYIYEVTSAASEPIIKDDNPADLLDKVRNDGYWGQDSTPVKVKTINVTNAATAGGAVSPWTVYFNQLDATLPNANIDDKGAVIFERGKDYFIRYEIVTDGQMEDVRDEKRYPHCAYDGLSEMQVPFYRSNVFGIARQTPTIQRYIYDTVTTAEGSTIQTWKYKLNDPDNAILAYVQMNRENVAANVVQYENFEKAFAKEDGSAATLASLTALYDEATKLPKNTYEAVNVSGLENTKWYTLEIPYCIYEYNTRAEYEEVNHLSLLSVPTEIKMVDDIVTEIENISNSATDDYLVNGVMIKDVYDVKGVNDEYGYRIKISLQGTQVDRVAALKVTITGTDDSGAQKVVVYDPIPVTMQNGTNGVNTFAYAYLEYAPIVNAGINHRTVSISAEAYYTTNRVGMNTFSEYTDLAHTSGFTADNHLFANTNAWALKQYTYAEENGITSYSYAYQTIPGASGSLQPSINIYKDAANTDIVTRTLNGSVFIPQSSGGVNIGFDESNLRLYYAVSPLVYTADGTFADVMYGKTMPLTMDEVGAKTMDGNYYVVEQLGRKPLRIDFGDPAQNYEVATFTSGDGMPGISYNTSGSSTGMSSATVQFDIKGKLPGADQGYYISLYPQGSSTPIALEKWKDADGSIYYLVAGKNPTTDVDTKLSDVYGDEAYGLVADADSNGGKVTFAIRGLERSTTYQVKVQGKDTLNALWDLFDYTYESGGRYYPFKTTSMIKMNCSDVTYVYNSYDDKFGNLGYAVEGSEGTGMRIFYKVYDESGAEVKCGTESYDDELGYRLEPLGNNVKYYQSDMSLCIPAKIDFSPGGVLQMGAKYKIEYKAYVSTNAGVVLDRVEPIGVCETTFQTPISLAEPRVSMRVVSGMDSLTVTVVMYDNQKAVYNDEFFVDVYDLAGNLITTDSTQLKFTSKDGSVSTAKTGIIENLEPNQIYRVVVTAKVDRDNDGTPEINYVNELTGTTISTATATVSTSYTEKKLTFKLFDMANFSTVDRIVYSIDSQDGSTNFENVDQALSKWTVVGNTYSYTTGFEPENGTYHYTLQFYSGNSLVGSTSGYFTK